MQLSAQVECGKFFKADRGTLTFNDGQLRFEADGRVFFDIPLTSAERIIWHWYSFSAAFEVTTGGQSYFLSFIPRAATLGTWYNGLVVGRRWRAAMEGIPTQYRPPIAARVFVIVIRIARIFIVGCFALLCLGAALEPASSLFSRIMGGAGAIALAIYCLALAVQGIKAIATAMRTKE
jgi:hypothetical protein